MSRLDERVEPLERRQRQPEPNTALKLLTADELRRALALARGSGRRPAPRHHVLRRDLRYRREDLQRNRIQTGSCRARRALRGPDRVTLKVSCVATTLLRSVTVGVSSRRVTAENPMLSYLTKNGACRHGQKEADPP